MIKTGLFPQYLVTRDASDSDSRSHGKSTTGNNNTGSGQSGKVGCGNANAVTDMAELNKGIRREVTRLSERWSALLVHANQWQSKLDDMLPVGFCSFTTVIALMVIGIRKSKRIYTNRLYGVY